MQKLFVISGVTSGLGQALMHEASGRGYPVEGIGRSPLAEPLKKGNHYTQMDLSQADDVRAFWQQIYYKYGNSYRVVLINNAGKFHHGSFAETGAQKVAQLMADNYLTTVNMVKAFTGFFDQGSIINMNSVAGLAPRANLSAYGAAKAALRHFINALRQELSPNKYRIMNLYPRRINTWSDGPEADTIDRLEAARWIIDLALLDGSFEISDVTILPFENS